MSREALGRNLANGRVLMWLVLVAAGLFFGSILFIVSRVH
jgi:hypothetical protein